MDGVRGKKESQQNMCIAMFYGVCFDMEKTAMQTLHRTKDNF